MNEGPGDGLPAGYGAHKSGLIVPDAQARAREVWTNDDWKRIKRALLLLDSRTVDVRIQCKHKGCPSPAIIPIVDEPEGFLLRCGCTNRIVFRMGDGKEPRAERYRTSKSATLLNADKKRFKAKPQGTPVTTPEVPV